MPMSSKQFLYCVRQEIYKESDLLEHIEKSIMEHQQGHLNIRPVISAKLITLYKRVCTRLAVTFTQDEVGDLWVTVSKFLDKNLEKKMDEYDPYFQTKSGKPISFSDYIITCVENGYKYNVKKKTKIDKEDEVIARVFVIFSEIVKLEKADISYKTDLVKLKELTEKDNKGKIYHYSDEVLNIVCKILQCKYSKDYSDMNAVKLRRELILYEAAKNPISIESSDEDGKEMDIPVDTVEYDYVTELIDLNSIIPKMLANASNGDQYILRGRDIFFFNRIIENGWGKGFVDRFPNLCRIEVFEYVKSFYSIHSRLPLKGDFYKEFLECLAESASRDYKKFSSRALEMLKKQV